LSVEKVDLLTIFLMFFGRNNLVTFKDRRLLSWNEVLFGVVRLDYLGLSELFRILRTLDEICLVKFGLHA
jgi:hypothetical protein